MKKSLGVLGFIALSFALVQPSHAQLFQNGNTDCESITVIDEGGIDSNSVACKNFYAEADFDGNGFTDCALVTDETDITAAATETVSILINEGSAATDCLSGAGNQFQASQNYFVTGLVSDVTQGDPLSTIVVGAISPVDSTFDDFAAANTLISGTGVYATGVSLDAGGFGASPLTSEDADWDSATSTDMGFGNGFAEKTTALFDCDADGDLDAAMLVGNSTPDDVFQVNLLLNNGSVLESTSSSASTGVGFSSGFGALAIADFNGDDIEDVVTVINEGGTTFLQVCTNDGACSLTCDIANQVNANTVLSDNPSSNSIVAGDFDGNGTQDVAINTPGFSAADRGIALFFGDGNEGFTSDALPVAYVPEAGASPVVLATGCFDNDNNPDVTVSSSGSGAAGLGSVGVFTRITSASVTSTSLTFNGDVDDLGGIDAADFDNLGGDDILVVGGLGTGSTRTAFVFMNTEETIAANAGSDVTIENTSGDIEGGSSVELSGACTIDPEDDAASFAVTWTLTSPTSGAVISGSTTLTPTFTATVDGVYTVTLSCRTRCDDIVTDTVVITVGNGILEGSGVFWGGCSFNPLASFSLTGISMMLSSLVLLFALRRRK